MKVKVCGVTTAEDAALAVELGAGLIGINFWPGSPRGVSLRRAGELASAVGGRALKVGVFVDQDPAFIANVVAAASLDLVQLHGDEVPGAFALAVPALATKIVKAFRVDDGFDPAVATAPWADAWGWLFDASRPGLYGGTGASWSWERVAGLAADRRVLVAGGVAPGRLRGLLAAAGGWQPWGIDVCSGVERSPGIKDPGKLRALFEEVRDVEAPTLA
jgi:phosphoribosylanthranilate isomerase